MSEPDVPPAPAPDGLACPECGNPELEVVYTKRAAPGLLDLLSPDALRSKYEEVNES